MSKWQPADMLKPGHYVTGRFADGAEHGIYFDGQTVWNVATGQKVDGLVQWRPTRLV